MRTEFTEDDLHPNVKGYAMMAPLAQAAIDQGVEIASGVRRGGVGRR